MTEAEYLEADNRIHCVFYFIAPHRMKMLDREFIAQLAPIVPIIPVIAKADTMTVRERNEYLHIVKEALDEISLKLKESCIYDFKNEDLNNADEDDSIPAKGTPAQQSMERLSNIFAIVCDSSSERIYPWGTLRIDDYRHSDFRRLQSILFENGKCKVIDL
jgi:septin 2